MAKLVAVQVIHSCGHTEMHYVEQQTTGTYANLHNYPCTACMDKDKEDDELR